MHQNDPYAKSVMESWLRRRLDAWGWLIEICNQHSIKPFLCEEISEFLEVITRLRKEGDTLNLALAFKNVKLSLEQPLVQVDSFEVKNHSKFSDLKDSVNGHPLCYVLDGDGNVNIGQIPQKMLCAESCLLTLKNVSDAYQTITICLANRVLEVCNLGKLVRVNRGGFWVKPCAMSFTQLFIDGFPLDLLSTVLSLCMRLSSTSKGSVIVLAKNDNPQFRSPLINKKFDRRKISDISDEQLTNFLMIDGAAVLNTKGELLDIAQHLEAPYSSECFVESGRGAKHNSASMYSQAVDCVVFVVSHEGPITVYYKGNIYARYFGEIFGYS